MQKKALGFIGVGRMGRPMAARLLAAGHPLHVFDTDPQAMAALVARGALAATSPMDLASRVETTFCCLPTPAVARRAALGDDGLAHGSAIRTLIDLGTTGPAMARTIGSGLAARNISLVDAPVTGGIAGAEAGTLAVMVSCPRETLPAVEPLLANLGRVIYTGAAPGLAQVAKLANNLLSAAALAVSSEAIAMGVKAGLDARVLIDIINAGSGRNSATEDKFPRAILTRTFDFGITTELFLKDVRLAVSEGESLGVPMVVGAAVQQMFAVAHARFGPDCDFTTIARLLEEWAGITMSDDTPGQ